MIYFFFFLSQGQNGKHRVSYWLWLAGFAVLLRGVSAVLFYETQVCRFMACLRKYNLMKRFCPAGAENCRDKTSKERSVWFLLFGSLHVHTNFYLGSGSVKDVFVPLNKKMHLHAAFKKQNWPFYYFSMVVLWCHLCPHISSYIYISRDFNMAQVFYFFFNQCWWV